jgi:hypothetical protein
MLARTLHEALVYVAERLPARTVTFASTAEVVTLRQLADAARTMSTALIAGSARASAARDCCPPPS